MALEEDAPPPRRRRLDPLLLDSLGIDELRLYIGELKAEIARVEAEGVVPPAQSYVTLRSPKCHAGNRAATWCGPSMQFQGTRITV